MKKLLLIFFSVLLFQSCLKEDNTIQYEYETLIIDEVEIPDSFTFGEMHEITIKYSLPNSCYSFYSLYYAYEETSRIVAVNASKSLEGSCTEVVIQQEYTFTVTANQEEDYVFKFWKGKDVDGNNIFEEITIPVN